MQEVQEQQQTIQIMPQVMSIRHELSAGHYIYFIQHPDEVFPVGRDVRTGKHSWLLISIIQTLGLWSSITSLPC